MKRNYKEVFEYKKPSQDSIPGPATSTSTVITIPIDFSPSIPAVDSGATASAQRQVTAGISVSIQLFPLHL